jgi:hypothetical protein
MILPETLKWCTNSLISSHWLQSAPFYNYQLRHGHYNTILMCIIRKYLQITAVKQLLRLFWRYVYYHNSLIIHPYKFVKKKHYYKIKFKKCYNYPQTPRLYSSIEISVGKQSRESHTNCCLFKERRNEGTVPLWHLFSDIVPRGGNYIIFEKRGK